MYGSVGPAEANDIDEQHLIAGAPVERVQVPADLQD